MTTRAATPWGQARVVDEVKIAQRARGKAFSSILQLLETDDGERLVRIAYTTNGIVRRGPVTLRPRDLEQLRSKVARGSPIAAALGWSGDA